MYLLLQTFTQRFQRRVRAYAFKSKLSPRYIVSHKSLDSLSTPPEKCTSMQIYSESVFKASTPGLTALNRPRQFCGLSFPKGIYEHSPKLLTGLEWFCRIIDHSNACWAHLIPRVQSNSCGLLQGFPVRIPPKKIMNAHVCQIRTSVGLSKMYNEDLFNDKNKSTKTFNLKKYNHKNYLSGKQFLG